MVTAIATTVSAIAFVAGTLFVVVELRQAAKDRYLNVCAGLFTTWYSVDFQDDQLYLLHKMSARSYEEFLKTGRGERAERAIHRVGGFYDHIGHLVLTGIIRQEEILPTIGGDAIRVWRKIESLVREARRAENALLFQHYEAVLPNCLECYVPIPQVEPPGRDADRIEPAELKKWVERDEAVVLDVSKSAAGPRIAGALRAEPNDLRGWVNVLPRGKSVATYCT